MPVPHFHPLSGVPRGGVSFIIRSLPDSICFGGKLSSQTHFVPHQLKRWETKLRVRVCAAAPCVLARLPSNLRCAAPRPQRTGHRNAIGSATPVGCPFVPPPLAWRPVSVVAYRHHFYLFFKRCLFLLSWWHGCVWGVRFGLAAVQCARLSHVYYCIHGCVRAQRVLCCCNKCF